MRVHSVELKIIDDSRLDPTIEASLNLDGQEASASVPSGKSKGKNEAVVVEPQKALYLLEDIKSRITQTDFNALEEFDLFLNKLDGTADKHRLGGNLILALSSAFTKAWAKLQKLETFQLIAKISNQKAARSPLLFFNLIEGGVHVKNGPAFQEYLFVPDLPGAEQSLKSAQGMIKVLGGIIQERYGQLVYGDEGGFSIGSDNPEAGLQLLDTARKQLGQEQSFLSLDVAASTFYRDGRYKVGQNFLTWSELFNLYVGFVDKYNLLSIEDPYGESDYGGFENITAKLGGKIWVVGDDLTTTNVQLIKRAQKDNLVNAVIIKPTQIGSVSEAIRAALLAKSYGWKIIISHRSGETMDDFIADLAFGLGADGLKAGSPSQKERLVKYERVVRIEELRA
ncbi:hypothetical protein HYW46_02240 [Candidatus Daviesbacteria bacterium]|nr:hypothetical protein [Candidatus Daviesbacteria bacterium]